MTKFIAVTQGVDYRGIAQGPGYIRADKIVSVLAYSDEESGRALERTGTMIQYTGGNGELCSTFVTELPDEVFKRLNVVLDSERDHTAQAWFDVFVNNIPAIEGACKALNNR